MAAPETAHKGFRIHYCEVMERWDCREIGKHSATLKGVRSQIDAHQRKMRKGVAVDAFEMNGVFRFQNLNQSARTVNLTPAKVVEYLGADTGRYSRGSIDVAVIPGGGSRKKVPLKALYRATKENEDIAERAHQKGLEAVSAINQMNLILSEMETLKSTDVEALIRLTEALDK